ncbi:DNA-binding CsgD family transcriptional regulator [Kutzneria kofuensis]|uniref:DNA-binding CsgD family transcriptional regulator n=1 Tax=Kutzneria kofuensis TaxID=103725 RepID=A0A7W9KPG5_9PSEU|nr:DNA-binding CsgD family transcriptional regulator [Kutzneria kofuensis]
MPETYCSGRARSALFAELVRLFGSLRHNELSAVLFDDLHAAPNPGLVVTAARHAGCTVVAACREDGIAEPTSLGMLADHVLDLRPLTEAQVDELMTGAVRGVLDQSVAPAVRTALGSLCGNPGAVLSVLESLRQQGRLVPLRGMVCLADPDQPIALPADHELVRLVERLTDTGPQLVALAATADRFRVDDLLAFAESTGRDLGACGRTVDLLVAAGILACDSQGALSVSCPALATTVLAGLGEHAVLALHGGIAEHLLRAGHPRLPQPALVADHVALAGAALPPTPDVVPLLCAEATRVLAAKPELAARWYRAALAHCRADDPARARELTGSLLRLLVRIGRYDWLGDFVAEVVAAGVPDGQRYEVAVGAALAALHTGAPVPSKVWDELVADPAGRAPLEFTTRWFEGREEIRLDELAAAFAPFRVGDLPDGPQPTPDDWGIAAGRHDLVVLFGYLLGDEYGRPRGGPLGLYHRVITGYHRGEWAEVLSAARALELCGPAHTPVHQLSRLLATEIRACEGELKLAAEWLAEAREDCPFPAMWSWAEIGLLWRAGEVQRAIDAGWRGYERAAAAAERGTVVGLHWLLVRLAMLESEAGNVDKLLELSELARKWYGRYGGRRLQMAELMLGGLAERDFASAHTAVEVLRKHDNQSELMRACLIASSVADEPRPWLHEAYDIAKRLGGDRLRMVIKARMRECGVTPPRQRAASQELSEVEIRVIALIQRGLTNRQIAAAERVSEKTVESYLTRLFAKTGCRSRLDLATASLEGRLTLPGCDRSGTA